MVEPLWTPSASAVSDTQLSKFQQHIAATYAQHPFTSYGELHQWSINNIEAFWAEVWRWPSFGTHGIAGERADGVKASKLWDKVVDTQRSMQDNPTWFEGARLNWAENMLLASVPGSSLEFKTAIIECYEPVADEADGMTYRRTSHHDLRDQVHLVQLALKKLGLREGQVVGYYGPICTISVVLLLAVSSLGAIFSSSASDFGAPGVVERFSQFGASLFGVVGSTSCRYNGKRLDQRSKLSEVVSALDKSVVKISFGEIDKLEGWTRWEQLLEMGRDERDSTNAELEFAQLPFDHPLWVLFSSGTTGKPKPIIHRAGGMLLQSKKEHLLHGNMSPRDVFFYYTTMGWMMANYLISGLGVGAPIVLYDGSPLSKPASLWRMVDDLGVTVFGTSAKYLDVLSTSYRPKEHHDLSSLKQLLSTGSPLKASLFGWVYENIKGDLVLGSITGGTDICSLFGAHNASLPVFAGEIQCLGLGMAVASFSDEGAPQPLGEAGELVCTKVFPCMPLGFWSDEGGKRYRESYFERFPGVWGHGDYCIITERGGMDMRGRSDGILNPSGVRFGSSEIYEVIDTLVSEGIEDSLVVAQKTQGGADERVVLFLKMAEGATLSEDAIKTVKLKIRTMRSARHVPERILAITDIPYTINGKKVEVPIKKILGGAAVSNINPATLRNPECLQEYAELGKMLRKEVQ